MKSRKLWLIEGSAIEIEQHKHHYFFKLKGKLQTEAFEQKSNIHCYIPIKVFDSAPKCFNIHKHFKIKGHLIFNKGENYFVAEEIL